jgi:predicted GIY-YIG superfamily endonuclease
LGAQDENVPPASRQNTEWIVLSGSNATIRLEAAMLRERRIKGWRRTWKVQMIEQQNPLWIDLYPGIAR